MLKSFLAVCFTPFSAPNRDIYVAIGLHNHDIYVALFYSPELCQVFIYLRVSYKAKRIMSSIYLLAGSITHLAGLLGILLCQSRSVGNLGSGLNMPMETQKPSDSTYHIVL